MSKIKRRGLAVVEVGDGGVRLNVVVASKFVQFDLMG